jgi:hypothetical protein
MRPDSFITIGYIGPSRTPTSETAIAPPIRDGTSQTTSSRLGISILAGEAHLTEESEPDSEEDIDEYREALADLKGNDFRPRAYGKL